jgi:hypothetical protein
VGLAFFNSSIYFFNLSMDYKQNEWEAVRKDMNILYKPTNLWIDSLGLVVVYKPEVLNKIFPCL